MRCHWSGMRGCQSQILVAVHRSHGVGPCSPDSPNLGQGRALAPPQPPPGGLKRSTYGGGGRGGWAAEPSLTYSGGVGRCSISEQAWVFSLLSAFNSSDKVSEPGSPSAQKTPSFLRTPSSGPPGSPDLASGGPPLPKDPPARPRGPLTVLESSSCRDCASTLSTPAWSTNVTKPKPLRRGGERQMVTGQRGAGGARGGGGGRGLTWISWSGGPASPDTPSPPRTGRSIRAALLQPHTRLRTGPAPRPPPPRPLPPVTPARPRRPRARRPERSGPPARPPRTPVPAPGAHRGPRKRGPRGAGGGTTPAGSRRSGSRLTKV